MKRTFKNPQNYIPTLNDLDGACNQPDTISIWGIIGGPIKIMLAFVLGFVLLAHWPDVQEWMDETFDKSDQMKTGVVILGIGSVAFVVLFFTSLITKR